MKKKYLSHENNSIYQVGWIQDKENKFCVQHDEFQRNV